MQSNKLIATLLCFGFLTILGGIITTLCWYLPLYNNILTENCLVNSCNSSVIKCAEKINDQTQYYPCYDLCVNYTSLFENLTKEQCIVIDENDNNNWCENRRTITCYLDKRENDSVNLNNMWLNETMNSLSLVVVLFSTGFCSIFIPCCSTMFFYYIRKEVNDVALQRVY